MKKLILLIAGAFVFPALSSCNFNCGCTEKACFTNNNPSITLSVDLADTELTADAFQDIFITQTDLNFEIVNTFSLAFTPEQFGSTQLILRLDEESTGISRTFLESNFIINNRTLSQVDTISNIQYTSTEREEVCNECTGGPWCDDENFTVISYAEPELLFNEATVNSFVIPYTIKD